MARPKPDLPSAVAIRTLAGEKGRLSLRATPGARSEGIFIESGRVLVKVRAKPQNGVANAAVLELLATALGCPPSHLEILRGVTGREKLLQLPAA